MEPNQQTSKKYFKILSVIHFYLVLGIVLFGLIVSFVLSDTAPVDAQSGLAKLFVYLVPGLVIVGIVTSKMIFEIKRNALKENADLKSKLMGYRGSLIIRYMLLEAPALFALVTIYMTNDLSYMVYAVFMIIMLVLKRPTRKSTGKDLQLSQQEIDMLEDSDFIIR